MKVLFLASEAVPFVKTGGLADVAGSLPKELKKNGIDVRVALPLYKTIDNVYRSKMKKVTEFYVDLDWKHQYAGVYAIDWDDVTYYFIDNLEYFDRPSPYGYDDDGERFIFFSKATTLLSKKIDFKPDIIHTNDWHTALVNVYVNDFRKGDHFFDDIKTLFTIHNLKYQGVFDSGYLKFTGLDGSYFNENDLKYYEAINLMKGGIVHCNYLNTVSKNYAREIKYPFYGEGLDGIIRKYEAKLSGIVNGIDYDIWNPKTDEFIFKNYSLATIKNKKANKLGLQKLYSLPQREDVPLIGICSRLTAMKGFDLVRYILEELLQEDIQLVIIGTGDYTYEEMFKYFEWKYPKKVAARIYYDGEESHKLYAGCDFLMMPSISEPCGISQLIAMKYATLPIVREAGGLKDTVIPYNEYTKEGTGYSFKNINAHELLFTTKKAIEVYLNKKDDHLALMKNAMSAVHDWKKSAEEYVNLYESLI
ncbi:MAG: glycogen synthase GlgA [Peptoniphilaceae bacterium]|nr:glycogen synthase GlgA [Peptoniphilaceae bacterium]MDY6018029.1 glycogen synthase GlgA [Anaerococcus sp.]